ncbi:MAG: hypothetical protein HUK40_18605 [Desulfobacter sp.]|nr:hypothetical protein [Desulfobacter sp.]
MDALPLIAKFRAKIVCVMFQVLFCIVLFSGNAHGFYEKKGLNIEAYSMAELKAVIDEYRIQAKVINKQI